MLFGFQFIQNAWDVAADIFFHLASQKKQNLLVTNLGELGGQSPFEII
jgi:hypothetical protein